MQMELLVAAAILHGGGDGELALWRLPAEGLGLRR